METVAAIGALLLAVGASNEGANHVIKTWAAECIRFGLILLILSGLWWVRAEIVLPILAHHAS